MRKRIIGALAGLALLVAGAFTVLPDGAAQPEQARAGGSPGGCYHALTHSGHYWGYSIKWYHCHNPTYNVYNGSWAYRVHVCWNGAGWLHAVTVRMYPSGYTTVYNHAHDWHGEGCS